MTHQLLSEAPDVIWIVLLEHFPHSVIVLQDKIISIFHQIPINRNSHKCTFINILCRRKDKRSKQGQTNNKAKQHSTPKAVSFPKKKELPCVGWD